MKSVRWLMVVGLIIMMVGCAPAVAQPSIVRIGWAGSPDTLNPGPAVLTESYTLFELIYDSLYSLEPDGSYTLDVAESVEVSDDGTVWTFKIRPDQKWHDGQQLTAKDVAFSLNFYKENEDFPYLNVYTQYFDSVEAPDDSTVVVTLTDAIPNMESQLIYLYILPEHIWGELEGNEATEFANTEMIGSGPFQMVEYTQNESVHLRKWPDNHRWSPKVDELVFQTFDNQDALVQAIKTGQVDMITEMPSTAIPTLSDVANVKIANGPPLTPYVTDIFFNQVTPENCPPDDGLCTGHPALLDRNVRLALAHATDKEQIIQVVQLGYATQGLTLIPDSLGVYYNNSLTDYEFDTAKSNQILEDAGYVDTDGDGVREMPDGSRPLSFRMSWPSDSVVAPRMAEMLNDMWAQVGVKTELQALDPDALTSACCPAFDYDVILWGWGSDPDPGFLLSVMTTDEVTTGNSETGYSNPAYDELFQQQSVELDPQKRKEIIWEMQKIVHDEVVYIIPFYEQAVQAYRTDKFKGWLIDAGKIALEDVSNLAVIEPVQ
jgi:peptide/nickel transport system substrate-binding protein